MKIRDLVNVKPQPTVVRLDELNEEAGGVWITESYYITEESERHFKSLRSLLRRRYGCGIFLIGHYGSGKSHFLAYLTQRIREGSFSPRAPDVVPISLLNFKASRSLESIIEESLRIGATESDRRVAWNDVDERHKNGLVLVMDELSEFLRSKASRQTFNEDIRFLQFMGEWSQSHAFWILAALQEQIEHAGEIEYDLFRKIKDRYPIRYILTPTHVKSLIAGKILRKEPGYEAAVERLAGELRDLFPASSIDFADFREVYPIHPATLELLEEVRDRFSQARGIVDFTLTQLLGDEARGVAPYLERPWGTLISPDVIVDHFLDLLEVQPEFQGIAQRVLPYYRKNMSVLFENPMQQDLAWRLLKLLVLVYLSPSRKSLDPKVAAEWLLFKVSTIDPQKNLEVVERALSVMVKEGSYLKREGPRYRLDVEDDSKQSLDRLLGRTIEELQGRGDALFEMLIPCIGREEFNPFSLPRARWHSRKIRWHFHEREIEIYFGAGPAPDSQGIALQIGLPWGPAPSGRDCFKIVPRSIELTPEILELAALVHLKERPLAARVLKRVEERIAGRSSWFATLVKSAYAEAVAMLPSGATVPGPMNSRPTSLDAWLTNYGEWMLRQTYPQFERFAPGHGPLPREAYRQFMAHAQEHDLCSEQAPEFVKLIREAYLVPMGLMQRRGLEYAMSSKLDQHELVTLLTPILEHHPTTARVYEHLRGPVYGLVDDQIHLLLVTLLVMGEIDIIKGNKSYRETYETLSNPIQYDKIVGGQALNTSQLRELQTLAEGFGVRVPKQWSVLAQRRAIEQLRREGRKQRDQASEFLLKLNANGEAGELAAEVDKLIGQWVALEKGETELQGFQHFLYEIGSPRAFVSRAKELGSLPDRFERLLREAQRFGHLFNYPCIAECVNSDIAVRLEALGRAPSPSDPEALEIWLSHARDLYQHYKTWYRARHDEWWLETREHQIWTYRKPSVAGSKHLALDEIGQEIETLRTKARSQSCADIASLEFQPLCRCGFDGKGAPVAETLNQFEEARRRLKERIVLFFGQAEVKARVKTWVEQGLEVNTQTLSYLEGQARYPEVENLTLFDQHLSGLELVRTVEADTILDAITDRTWQRDDLLKALNRLFERFGSRIAIRRAAPSSRKNLVAWCVEQALRYGCALPSLFSADDRKLMADVIQPEWVGHESLERLEEIGLTDEAVNRILEMVLDGNINPPAGIRSAPVCAALELLRNDQPSSPDELAARISLVYSQHHRFREIRPREWLSRLDELATTTLAARQEPLTEILKANLERQWLVIDCFGVTLLDVVIETARECLPHWRLDGVSYGLVSTRTSTEAFYSGLIEEGIQKRLEKIDGIDDLIHERKCSPSEFVQLARTEVEIAFRRMSQRFDPAKPLLIFGDHGFRLKRDGSGFTHGGPSTLERLVPVLRLEPF